jgi:tetratricopeptide (TPR) repeat protein/transcriptional regulator with XRE-family HTH domain
MIEDEGAFGARLFSRRQAARLSQAELAERAGMSVRAISNLERGRTKWPHPHSVQRLADALGLSPGARAEFAAAAGRRLARDGAASDGADPAVVVPAGRPARACDGRLVPRQLPGPVRQFTGRKNELAALTGLLDEDGASEPAAMLIALIVGMAGVGKTALAVHWAHQVASRFPGGQLYIDLRGYDPSAPPVQAGDALAGFLRALGVPGQDIPDAVDERAAAFRSLLAGERVLVVLDNARNVAQVRPLLPGSPGCTTLVTSRDALGGLVAGDGALRLKADLLPLPEAVDLLHGLIGSRVEDDRDAAARLAGQCGRLPLALRVAAELAAARGGVALTDLTTELADMQHRLELLETGGDQRTTIRAVFTWSYKGLNPAVARMFRLVGLNPGADISAAAAASLAGLPAAGARRALGELTTAHLLQEHAHGRFSCHDLLRAYAAGQAAAHDDEQQRRAALTRLFDYYICTAARAVDVLFPVGADRRLHRPQPADLVPAIDDEPAARAWLDAERANLAAVATCAARHGMPQHAIDLSATLFWHLDYGGYLSEAHTIHSSAVLAAAQIQDRAAQAHALINLGGVALRLSRNRQAADHYQQALALCRASGDRFGELRAIGSLAAVDQRESRYQQAAGHYRQVLDLCRELGIRSHEIRALTCLGQIDLLRGHHDHAAGHLRLAVDLCRQTGDHNSWADALVGLAEVDLHQGRYEEARARLEDARAVYRDTGNQASDMHAVYYSGLLELCEGHNEQAAGLLQRAREAFGHSGDRAGEARALCRLAELDTRLGRHQQAVDQLDRALNLCRQTGDPAGQAQALNALGDALLAASLPEQALNPYRDALDLALQIGAADAQARARHGLTRAHASLGSQAPISTRRGP